MENKYGDIAQTSRFVEKVSQTGYGNLVRQKEVTEITANIDIETKISGIEARGGDNIAR